MKKTNVFFRKQTSDFPLSVYYFAPSRIFDKPNPLQRGKHMLVLLVHCGEVEYYNTAGKQVLYAGDICLDLPYVLHAFRTVSMDTQYTLLKFSLGLFPFPSSHFFFQKFIQQVQSGVLKTPGVLRPGDPLHAKILEQMQRLDISKEGSDTYTAELLSVAMSICTELIPCCSPMPELEVTQYSGVEAKEKCMQYLNAHYKEKITLQELADYVHLHPNYLCALFKEHTGKTIFEQLAWIRIHQSTKLLRSTNLPIQQISERCGFQNTNFFSRKFKVQLGCTPTQYRKKSRQKQ